MGEKLITYPLFHVSSSSFTERPLEKAYQLGHALEQLGFSESGNSVKFVSGRKVFSLSYTWRKRAGMSERVVEVSVEGWEFDGKGRISATAVGKEMLQLEYSGFFESLVMDIVSERFRPGRTGKREEVERAIRSVIGGK